jgi:integrase
VHRALYYSDSVRYGIRYEVRHPRNAHGKYVIETLAVGTDLTTARRRANEVHGSAAPPAVNVGTTLAQVVVRWREHRVGLKPRTITSYDRMINLHILPALGRLKVRDLTAIRIEKWLAGLKCKDGEQMSEGTKSLALTTLLIVLAYAVREGIIASVPQISKQHKPKASNKKKKKETEYLTRAQQENLLARAHTFPWLSDMIVVGLKQGLRLGELCGLRWQDVDLARGRLTVAHSIDRSRTLGTTKSGKERTIQIHPEARKVLAARKLASGGVADVYVFANGLGRARDPRDAQRAMTKARDRAGLTGVSFHTLRHTCATEMANDPRIPLKVVRDFLGHSSIQITEKYLHAAQDGDDLLAGIFAEEAA